MTIRILSLVFLSFFSFKAHAFNDILCSANLKMLFDSFGGGTADASVLPIFEFSDDDNGQPRIRFGSVESEMDGESEILDAKPSETTPEGNILLATLRGTAKSIRGDIDTTKKCSFKVDADCHPANFTAQGRYFPVECVVTR